MRNQTEHERAAGNSSWFIMKHVKPSYQEVDGVVGFDPAARQHGLRQRRHHILHEVVPQRESSGLKQLMFLLRHLRRILLLMFSNNRRKKDVGVQFLTVGIE